MSEPEEKPMASSDETVKEDEIPKNETPEEKYRREKLAEIAERKAQEVFVTRDTGKYECQACGYVYDESKGFESRGIPPNTPFENIEKFRCPQCGASKKYFVAETETLSGFKENLKYGLGTNSLTGGQKQNLIFGGLFLAFLLFMSGYLLE
jgi:rubredoxin